MDTDQIIADNFITAHPKEAIHIIEKLEYNDIADFIRETPLDLAVKVLLHMNNYKAAKCLQLLDINIVGELIENMDLLLAELLLRQCDEEFRNTLLDNIATNISEKIRQKIKYAANSVGTYMRPKVFSLRKDVTVSEALELMKKERELMGSEIFVTDEKSRIEGVVKIAQLALADGADQISSILTKDIPKFHADDPVQTISNHPAWATYRTLPVIERSEALIGSLYFEDISQRNLKKDTELAKQMVETGSALGELYWIGLTGLLQSIDKSD